MIFSCNVASTTKEEQSQQDFEDYMDDIEGYLFAGIVFWIFCYGMSSYSQKLERKLDTDRRDDIDR